MFRLLRSSIEPDIVSIVSNYRRNDVDEALEEPQQISPDMCPGFKDSGKLPETGTRRSYLEVEVEKCYIDMKRPKNVRGCCPGAALIIIPLLSDW